ncbi:MAG: hypothetical protein L6416_00160, partial [Candidatus Omnitrophica bacterium]|nr:hypothetical protein [Candidatus Omnitrophota bacterium]
MPGDDLIHIQLKKIIHAKKWKVVRQLTKVWEFPSYIPCVREAVVIKKERNKMKTRWCIQIDKFPITWEEEETLSLRQNSIFFKAVGGDLDKFKGEWIFKNHAEGTEVTVNIYLKLDIPVIRIFSEAHIKDLITRNFEAILESLENHMVSKRYAAYRRGDKGKISGFAILGHFYNFNHLVRCLKMLNPDFHIPSQEFLSSLFTMTPSFKIYDMKEFLSKTGTKTHGCFIVCTFIPEMLDKDVHAVYSKVVRACKLAEKQGVGIVALGGFTSMVGERLGHQISEEVDVSVTTGNTYTAALA